MTELTPEKVVRLSPLVRRITQNNPGVMTGPGTNTYLIGTECVLILDPGEDTGEHYRAIMEAVAGRQILGIAPTHAHPDHWPLAPRLAKELACPTIGRRAANGFVPDRTVYDGELLETKEWTLTVLHTPGHTADHISFLSLPERALFSGDHVMGWSTSVIARPDGSLASYLESLDRLLRLEIALIYPAHGMPIENAPARITELIAHRRMRTAQIMDALAAGLDTVPLLTQRVYQGLDARLVPAARESVLAHLVALMQSGRLRVKRQAADPMDAVYGLSETQ